MTIKHSVKTNDEMNICHSFPPAGSKDPVIMILGSMPGKVSLQLGQYYAHPQNAFWKIMGDLFGAYPRLPYEERIAILAGYRIALWESLQSCVRPGSADTAIKEEVPNDFNTYFTRHRHVRAIYFDGQKAFNSFNKLIVPGLKKTDLSLICLPSTSPRHASVSYENKLEAWQRIKGALSE